jgi:hypothetical protein
VDEKKAVEIARRILLSLDDAGYNAEEGLFIITVTAGLIGSSTLISMDKVNEIVRGACEVVKKIFSESPEEEE